MLNKVKLELAKNRYFGNVRNRAVEMPRGIKRSLFILGGCIDVLIKHGFHLNDYQNEVNEVKKMDYIFRFKSYGQNINMFVPNYEVDYLQKQIVTFSEFWEIAVLEELRKSVIKPGDMILDIGANIGNHTVFFGKICKARKIDSFEPVESTYKILKRNIELNGLEKTVTLHNVALGSSNGNAKIKYFNANEIGSTQVEKSDDGNMKLKRLDDYAFNRIDFIKIDVEKYEVELLKGAEKTLSSHSPQIFIEIFKDNFTKANKLLNEYGYYIDREFSLCNYLYKKRA